MSVTDSPTCIRTKTMNTSCISFQLQNFLVWLFWCIFHCVLNINHPYSLFVLPQCRKALANALAIAPSMWTLGNAGMGALQVILSLWLLRYKYEQPFLLWRWRKLIHFCSASRDLRKIATQLLPLQHPRLSMNWRNNGRLRRGTAGGLWWAKTLWKKEVKKTTTVEIQFDKCFEDYAVYTKEGLN